MNKRRIIAFLAALFFCILLSGLIYLGLAIYYEDTFLYGTWINGIYCTGKTPEEVQQELTEEFSYAGVEITGNGSSQFCPAQELGLEYDFLPVLQEFQQKQDPYLWFFALVTGQQTKNVIPEITVDEKALADWLEDSVFVRKMKTVRSDYLSLRLTSDGYVLQENKQPRLSEKEAGEAIAEALLAARNSLDLEEAGCYTYGEETERMQEVRREFALVDELQSRSIVYQIKEAEKTVTPGEIAGMIQVDDNQFPCVDEEGNVAIDAQAVADFISGLAADYDTYENYRFTTHDGREITLNKGTYGTKINQKQETSFLLAALQSSDSEPIVRTPVYTIDHTYEDRNQLDYTYIEVDMSAQKMFYYVEGEEVLETDVVTGCVSKGMATPEMVCYVYNKQLDAILTGGGTPSYVRYWIPVYKGIGIHDASWRNKFGGTIYQNSGSHGCINTPKEEVGKLYEMVEIGTPVVIYN